MSRLIHWVAAPLMAATLMFAADAPKADAGGFSLHIGTGGGFYGPSRGFSYSSFGPRYGHSAFRPNYGYGYSSFRPGFGYSSFRSVPRVHLVPTYGHGFRAPVVVPNRGYYHRAPNRYRGRYFH